MTKLYVKWGLVEHLETWATVGEDDEEVDNYAWIDADLYNAWRIARVTYQVLTAQLHVAVKDGRVTQ